MSFNYYVIYKPFQVLTRFGKEDGKDSLADYFKVPVDVYPVGRLDYDSEGLLILSNDKSLTNRLLDPKYAHEREYWVQVDGPIDDAAVRQLRQGVSIAVDGKKYQTRRCQAEIFNTEPAVPERNPPIRFRKSIPAPWIRLILQEGKNRQVRKMTAAAGFPTLRLIRYRIAGVTIDGIQPGEMREMSQQEIYRLLFK